MASTSDNRAARRRQSAREMRALLEGFVAVDPLDIDDGCYLCRYCAARFTGAFAAPVAADHRPDCLWRYAVAWLAHHHPK